MEWEISIRLFSMCAEHGTKTVVAFANGNGGKIVFGIDDKTLEIVGMDEDNIFKTMDAITNAISDSCEPRIRPDVTLQTVNDRTVIVVDFFALSQMTTRVPTWLDEVVSTGMVSKLWLSKAIYGRK